MISNRIISCRTGFDTHSIITEVCRGPGVPQKPHNSVTMERKTWNAYCRQLETSYLQGNHMEVPKLIEFFYSIQDHTHEGFSERRNRVPRYQLNDQFIRMYGVDKEALNREPEVRCKQVPYGPIAEEVGCARDDVKYLVEDIVRYVGEVTASSNLVLNLNLGFCTIYVKNRVSQVHFSPHFLARLYEMDTAKWPRETKELIRQIVQAPRVEQVMRYDPFPCVKDPPQECSVCDESAHSLRSTIPPRSNTPPRGTPLPSTRIAEHPATFMPGSAVSRTFEDIAKQPMHSARSNSSASKVQPYPVGGRHGGRKNGHRTSANPSILDDVDDNESVMSLVQPYRGPVSKPSNMELPPPAPRPTMVPPKGLKLNSPASPILSPSLSPDLYSSPSNNYHNATVPQGNKHQTQQQQPGRSHATPTPLLLSNNTFLSGLMRDESDVDRKGRDSAREILNYNMELAQKKKSEKLTAAPSSSKFPSPTMTSSSNHYRNHNTYNQNDEMKLVVETEFRMLEDSDRAYNNPNHYPRGGGGGKVPQHMNLPMLDETGNFDTSRLTTPTRRVL